MQDPYEFRKWIAGLIVALAPYLFSELGRRAVSNGIWWSMMAAAVLLFGWLTYPFILQNTTKIWEGRVDNLGPWAVMLISAAAVASLVGIATYSYTIDKNARPIRDPEDAKAIQRLTADVSRIKSERDEVIAELSGDKKEKSQLQREMEELQANYSQATTRLDDREKKKQLRVALTQWLDRIVKFRARLQSDSRPTQSEFDALRREFGIFLGGHFDQSQIDLIGSGGGLTIGNFPGVVDKDDPVLSMWAATRIWEMRINQFIEPWD